MLICGGQRENLLTQRTKAPSQTTLDAKDLGSPELVSVGPHGPISAYTLMLKSLYEKVYAGLDRPRGFHTRVQEDLCRAAGRRGESQDSQCTQYRAI